MKKKFTTTKIAMFFIFINCTIIELYSMVAMWHFSDLSALYSLIGAVVGESLSFAVYCYKSSKENQAGGITYDLAMLDKQNSESQKAEG